MSGRPSHRRDPFAPLRAALVDPPSRDMVSNPRPAQGGRQAAVLILLSDTAEPDVTFTERGHAMRKHAGQISFPGGGVDLGDSGPVAAALRETHEEINLSPEEVGVLGCLPAAFVAASSFDVTSVVGLWGGTAAIRPVSAFEVADIHRFTVSQLADERNRVMAKHPLGYTGPGWVFGEVFIWGFTAHLTDCVLKLGGWEQPWDTSKVVTVPKRYRRDRISADHD